MTGPVVKIPSDQCVAGQILLEVGAQLDELSDDTYAIIEAHTDDDTEDALRRFSDDLRAALADAVQIAFEAFMAAERQGPHVAGKCSVCDSEFGPLR